MKARGCSKRRDAMAPLDWLVAANRQTGCPGRPAGKWRPAGLGERTRTASVSCDLAHREPEDIALVVRGLRTASTVAENPLSERA